MPAILHRVRRAAALLLILTVLLASLPAVLAEDTDAYPNTWVNTGNQAADIVGVALTQVGYQEEPDDHSKYNVWYYGDDTSLAWCSIFISWCADQADVETWVMPKNNQAKRITVNNMEDNPFGGTQYVWGETDPQPGDILFTAPLGQDVSTHTALVYETDENMVYTVEGNTKDENGNGAVVLQSYYLSDGTQREENDHILFLVRPEYHNYVCTASQAATCLETSADTYTCTVCGEEKIIYGTELADHNWDDGRLAVPVTQLTAGTVRYTCRVCGLTREEKLRAGGGLFTDVQDRTAWYYCAANWAVEKQITSGTGRFTFSPASSCTRGQTVTMLWRALGSPVSLNSGTGFEDVPADSTYCDAVAWALSEGITSGVSETEFAPDTAITRAQAITMLWRAAGSPEPVSDSGFADVPADTYYADAVAWAGEQQIVSGISNTAFGPDLPVTRAQLVTMLWRQAGSPEISSRSICIAGYRRLKNMDRGDSD